MQFTAQQIATLVQGRIEGNVQEKVNPFQKLRRVKKAIYVFWRT